ncbi:MAG: bifunctional diaminohydroxyphosphoribosylaminopyrimidine deaminase/5-amino-6-(5-phosphoribosylamino)uracil reductase RibD [Acidobacteria bacterium]|nr:bifunctional diaminohydroxyphosphoribosylaminopyrimidine deaminase/5-amino-6-(5-phosphoribosylamino)uracil reductase RibD [Acidobacteriota bacterium]
MNEYTEKDLEHMRRTLELSRAGIGLVSPNPLVGCVVVSESGEVIGEGTYIKSDVTHAEVIALMKAGANAAGGTAYVSLEPHDHHGKTRPCTEALINAGISRVVCPIEDPNPLVSGKGFDHLRSAGVEVVTGILAEEAARINEKFICWHRNGRPFIHLKLAMSLDGRISLKNSVSTALSGEAAQHRVHELRHEHDAIMVGATTASVDDPLLTDRSGKPRLRPLARVVLDNSLRLPTSSKLATTTEEAPTFVLTNCIDPERVSPLHEKGVDVILLEGGARNLVGVLDELKRREIQSILVEGGTAVAGAFIDAKLVDKVTFIFAPLVIGGSEAPNAVGGRGAESLAEALKLRNVTIARLGDDIEITGYPS